MREPTSNQAINLSIQKDQILENEQLGYLNEARRCVDFYRAIDQKGLSFLTDEQKAHIESLVKRLGVFEFAESRVEGIRRSTQTQESFSKHVVLKFFVVVVSAFLFFRVPQFLFPTAPAEFIVPFAMILGGVVGFFAEKHTADLLTQYKMRDQTHRKLMILDKQRQTTDRRFDKEYYQAQIELLNDVENDYFSNQLTLNFTISSVLILLEVIVAVYLAFTTYDDLAQEIFSSLIAAILTVTVIYVFANLESQDIKLPEEAHKLIDKYAVCLDSFKENGEEELQAKMLEVGRFLAGIKFLIGRRDSTGQILHWSMAEADFERKWWEKRLQHLISYWQDEQEKCVNYYDELEGKLRSKPVPEPDYQGLSEAEVEWYKEKIGQEHIQNIENELSKNEKGKEKQLGIIGGKYTQKISVYRDNFDKASKRFEDVENKLRQDIQQEIHPGNQTVNAISEEIKEVDVKLSDSDESDSNWFERFRKRKRLL